MLVRVAAGVLASKKGSFLKAALVQNRHFLAFAAGPGSAGSKRFIFKGRACTESSFLGFGTGPGVGEVQSGSFLKAGQVQHGHF